METIIKFCLIFMDKSYSIKFVKRECEISPKTIVDWASFCREVCINVCLHHGSAKLGGDGITIEIDESKFGKTKHVRGHKGRWNRGQWVFGVICRETGEFFMVPVQDRTKKTLLKIIKERILPGTTIISDCWKSYDCLGDEGFQHLSVNHSLTFKDPITGAHTNKVKRVGRSNRIGVAGIDGISPWMNMTKISVYNISRLNGCGVQPKRTCHGLDTGGPISLVIWPGFISCRGIRMINSDGMNFSMPSLNFTGQSKGTIY